MSTRFDKQMFLLTQKGQSRFVAFVDLRLRDCKVSLATKEDQYAYQSMRLD